MQQKFPWAILLIISAFWAVVTIAKLPKQNISSPHIKTTTNQVCANLKILVTFIKVSYPFFMNFFFSGCIYFDPNVEAVHPDWSQCYCYVPDRPIPNNCYLNHFVIKYLVSLEIAKTKINIIQFIHKGNIIINYMKRSNHESNQSVAHKGCIPDLISYTMN